MSRLWVSLMILLLAAHFWRMGESGLALCMVLVCGVHAGGRPWKRYAVGFVLVAGAFEWANAASSLAVLRLALGQPWLRGAFILTGVSFFTAVAAVNCFRTGGGLRRDAGERPLVQACAFILVFLALYFLRMLKPDALLLERLLLRGGAVQIVLMAWYAAFIAGKLVQPRSSRGVRRWAWLLFSLFFFGQLLLGILGVPHMLMTGQLHVPVPAFIVFGPVYRGELNMMPFLALFAALVTGRAWCSMLCYFGAFDALAAASGPVRPAPPWLRFAVRWGRLLVLALGVLVALGLRVSGQATGVAVGAGAVFCFVSLFVLLFFSRRHASMVHCTALCPMGLVMNLLGHLSPWRMRVDTRACDQCGACEKVCRYRAITAESRTRGTTLLHCSLCRDCTAVCAKKAVGLRAFGRGGQSEAVFIVLVVTLHVLFLSIARV